MEKDFTLFLEEHGLNKNEFESNVKISVEIDATGRRAEIENLAEGLDIEIEESDMLCLTAVDYISLMGSVITIIDFLLKLKKKYGKRLMVGIQSIITKDIVEMPVDDAIESIIKKQSEDYG